MTVSNVTGLEELFNMEERDSKLIAIEENNNNNIDIDLLLNMSKKFLKCDS